MKIDAERISGRSGTNSGLGIDQLLPEQRAVKSRMDERLGAIISRSEGAVPHSLLHDALFPGRRMRPFLLFHLVGGSDIAKAHPEIDTLALGVELAHRASIIVDDLMDRDIVRRSTPTFHATHGEDTTILIAHYLTSLAFRFFSKLPKKIRAEACQALADAYSKMCVGQLADVGGIPATTNYVALFRDTVLLKTSALFELVFRLALLVRRGLVSDCHLAIWKLGRQLGELYQIHNDIYDDLLASAVERGAGGNERFTLSLPVCIFLDNADPADKSAMLQAIYDNERASGSHGQLVRMLRCPSVLREAHVYAGNCWGEVTRTLEDIEGLDLAREIRDFAIWLRQDKCWDQKVVHDAGY